MKPDTYRVISRPNPDPGPLNHHVVSARYDFEHTGANELTGHGHWAAACSLHTRDEGEALERVQILNEFAEHQGFHWRDGRYFKRMSDGSVAVIDWSTDHFDVECGFRTPQIEMIIPALEWASIVASVSAGGEIGERWAQALEFHGAASGTEARSGETEGLDPKGDGPASEAGDAQP